MDFQTYWRSLSAQGKKQLAAGLRHSQNYLAQIACGSRAPSPRLAKAIAAVTGDTVNLHALRPDIWEEGARSPSKHTEARA